LRSALSAKLADAKLTVVADWSLGSHKTKEFRQTLSRLDGKTRTILVVEAPGNHNLELASRNLEGVRLVAPGALMPYDLLRHDRLMLSKDTALHLVRSLGNRSDAVAGEEVEPKPVTIQPAPAVKAKSDAPAKTAKPKAAAKSAAKPKTAKAKGKAKDKD
jgi:hypothetical protein